MNSRIVRLTSVISHTYESLILNSLDYQGIRKAVAGNLFKPVSALALELNNNPEGTLAAMTHDDCQRFFESEVVLLLSSQPQKQHELFRQLETQLWRILVTPAAMEAGRLIECLLLAVDELPASIGSRFLDILRSLTGREEGSQKQTVPPISGAPDRLVPRLSHLLDLGLFSEVFGFLSSAGTIQNPEEPLPPLLTDAAVASVVSRRGGVGKSTVVLSLALSHLLSSPKDEDLCILDLDITGPTWLDLLSADVIDPHRRPMTYLNELINIDQSSADFEFGQPSHESVLSCVADLPIPGLRRNVSLLTLADWPRTNRFLIQSIANNRGSFGRFLSAVILGLGKRFKRILIDNSPGFDTPALLSLAVVGRVRQGCPIVVSTPLLSDLRGTLLEMTDLRLLGLYRKPLWFINKTSAKACEFFNEPHNVLEVAAKMPAYNNIIPKAPLVVRAIPRHSAARNTRPLPFDRALVGSANVMETSLLDKHRFDSFTRSLFFKRFSHVLTDVWEG